MPTTPDFLAEADALLDEVTAMRHDLHQHPELGLELPRTQQKVLEQLDGLPLEIMKGTRSTSINAVLRGGRAPGDLKERPVVLLRADMDALPVPEQTGMTFASQVEGRFHACGHDIHTATLTGAAKILAKHAADLPGDVVFMFQTAEELLCGARAQIEDGVLEAAGKRADRAYGMHVMSATVEPGLFTTRPGTVMAASDRLEVDIIGKGGHGSAPHLGNDPVPVMAEVITALNTMVARKFNAFDPVVVTVGVANAGGAANVIPEKCHIECNIRTFSVQHREKMHQVIQDLVRGICEAHGCRAEMTLVKQVAPCVNDPEQTDFVIRQIDDLLGEGRYVELPAPYAGSEDFAEVLARVPGAFVFYSGAPRDRDLSECTFNHSATAWFDDYVLPEATALYAKIGWEALYDLAK